MQENNLKLGGAALNQTPLDWRGNVSRIRQAVAKAKEEGIQLLCLPELCLTGYGCEDVFLADWIYARCQQEILDLLPDSQGIAFTVGFPYNIDGVRYNGQAVLADGALLGIALKHHLAGEGVYYEPRWFASWPLGKTIEVDFGGQIVSVGHPVFIYKNHRIAFEICEDGWRGKERLGYFYSKQKIDVLLNPSASHFVFGKEKLRHILAKEGSEIINGAYVYVNLLGNEAGRLVFDGDIVIYRKGVLVAEAEPFAWGSLSILAEGFVAKNPAFLPPEAEYEQSCTLGLYDYMRKSRSKGFCLSLSGGADSACCAILVHRMILRLIKAYQVHKVDIETQLAYWPDLLQALDRGEESQVQMLILACLYQSTQNSTDQTRKAAQSVADLVGAVYCEVDITSQLNQYTKEAELLLGRSLTWEKDDLALQNIQARVRAPMIWFWTNLRGSLLITTSNRSEGSVGYSTMDGDMAGGIAPIAGVSKDFVRKWLLFAEKSLGYEGLSFVNQLPPTAELRPNTANQTDEADLMPYALLDQIENLRILQRKSEAETLAILTTKGEYETEYLETSIQKFTTLWSRNQWKRERLAPSFHLDSYSVDPKTWCRYPILSGE